MSKISLQPNASGTGTFTLEAPNSNTNRTLSLPDESGTLLTSAAAAPLYFLENVQTGNYTLALSDVAKVVAMDNAATATVTVPPNSDVAFPIGTVVNVYAMTANAVTIAEGSGVTVRNAGDIADQYVEVSLRKRATDEWVLSGQVA